MAMSARAAPAAVSTASGSWRPSTARRAAARSAPAPVTALEKSVGVGPRASRWATAALGRRNAEVTLKEARTRRGRVFTRAVTEPAGDAPVSTPPMPTNKYGASYDQTGQHTIELPQLTESSRADRFDLLIVGCGPAGLSAADRASSKGLRVALIDPTPLAPWRNNYGVWVDEFELLGLTDCFNKVWPLAKVVVDDEHPDGIELQRPYGQVNRIALKDKFLKRCVDQGVVFGACAVEGVAHEDHGSVVTLKGGLDGKFTGEEVHAKMVLDATGHARKLVEFEREFTPGYQAAFGIMCETEEPHGLDLDTMLFMDWRDEHLSPRYKEMNNMHPTFLYAMPFTETKIFFEETSLVERPGLEFDDLKVKLQQRLAAMGIKVKSVQEEEYCLIPMGGVLPTLPQRTLGVGGTAGMVHPSTGFMVSKTLLSVRSLIDTLADELATGGGGGGARINADGVAERVWQSVWPDEELRMRTFMCFGMETLMELDIKGTRQFFETFFQMSQDIWGGFLSWRIKPLGLVRLGGVLFFKFSNYMRFNFVLSALPFMASFVKNFATADNTFNSDKWGGLVLQKPKVTAVPGQGPIPRPDVDKVNNPAAEPISSSPLDFSTLVAGGDIDKPQQASKLRPDREWIEFQQRKIFKDQAPIVDVLKPLDNDAVVDVLVVGAGPAGLAVAAEMASRGVTVGLIAPDTPFVNNYGVWLDEFEELGLTDCLLHEYDDALVWFNDRDPAAGIGLNRGYGQVCRRRLREKLLARCEAAGVRYAPGLVDQLVHGDPGEPSIVSGAIKTDGGEDVPFNMSARVVVCGTGHNRDMLQYEDGPGPGWQTAYGVEVKMPGHPFEVNKAVFMDFRQSDPELEDGSVVEEGVWRVPSFLYVLPVDENTVFVEETCLVARVQVPFDELKRRLYRRLTRMGLNVTQDQIIEEEASWIPLGGTPPTSPQRTLAYGAAAGLVHPASGYSIVNSLRRAPAFADAVVEGLKAGGSVEAANRGWDVLWGDEPRRQVGFYQFGMELLMSLRIEQMRNFFGTFFALPKELSAGFLGNNLTSAQLLQFALTVFFQGNWELRALLLTHLSSAGAGVRLGEAYAYPLLKALGVETGESGVNVVDRKKPPQEPNFSSFARDLFSAEEQGFLPGFQGKDWWAVGTKPMYGEKRRDDDDDDDESNTGGGVGSSGGVGSGSPSTAQSASGAREVITSVNAATSLGGDQGSMAYWSNGSAALVVTSAVRNTGARVDDLYGERRKKFLPAALLNVTGQGVVPPYLTGEMPGDVGWDPLQMGAQRDIIKLRERELIHGRWAMLAAIGVLVPESTARLSIFGAPGQHWWNTAITWSDTLTGLPELTYLGETIPWGIFWLPIIHLPLFFVAELLRTGRLEVEAFRGLDRMYPGGKLFDPLGIGAGVSDEELKILKTIEIQHCRLAMIASFGFIVEALAWGAGPLDVFG